MDALCSPTYIMCVSLVCVYLPILCVCHLFVFTYLYYGYVTCLCLPTYIMCVSCICLPTYIMGMSLVCVYLPILCVSLVCVYLYITCVCHFFVFSDIYYVCVTCSGMIINLPLLELLSKRVARAPILA
jgi:hypothetical protein